MSQAIAFATEIKAESECYRVVGRPGAADGLPGVVLEMLKYFENNTNLGDACARAQISVSKGRAIVRKLTQMGMLEASPAPTPVSRSQSLSQSHARLRVSSQAFTPEEEAFFASEVQPIDECDEPFVTLGDKIELLFSELMLKLRGSPAV
jgi:hypothetical protein